MKLPPAKNHYLRSASPLGSPHAFSPSTKPQTCLSAPGRDVPSFLEPQPSRGGSLIPHISTRVRPLLKRLCCLSCSGLCPPSATPGLRSPPSARTSNFQPAPRHPTSPSASRPLGPVTLPRLAKTGAGPRQALLSWVTGAPDSRAEAQMTAAYPSRVVPARVRSPRRADCIIAGFS